MKSERKAFNGFTLFAVLLMTLNIFCYPITFHDVTGLVTVYVYLYSVWSGCRALDRKSESFEATLPSDQQPKFHLIRKQASLTCLVAVGGITTAFFIGNHAAAHWPQFLKVGAGGRSIGAHL